MTELLSCDSIVKSYGPNTVLNCDHFSVNTGEIHALLGANGAGKSTLCTSIAGLVRPDSGRMRLCGTDYQPKSKQIAEARGVEIVQQELNLVPILTVAENLFLSRLPHRLGLIRRKELNSRALQALQKFGLDNIDPDMPVGQLGVGHQQMVEIASALDRRCRLLILDEPTAALSSGEVDHLFGHLRSLRQQGIGIITITHRLDEVRQIADRVTVLRDGRHVATEPLSTLTNSRIIELMSGSTASNDFVFQSHSTQRCLLQVKNISGGLVRDVSFRLNAGQRLGIAGLVGSGRTELLRLIFGADQATSGGVILQSGASEGCSAAADSEVRCFRHPREAVAAGLAMITEDRKHDGLLLSQSLRFNSTLNSLGYRFARWGLIRSTIERREVDAMINLLEMKCQNCDQLVGTLSGGNQQKVAIARWLLHDAKVFLFDEPTRGIDIAARQRIYGLFESLAKSGKGLLIVSSDLQELLENCDQIGVMSAGRWVGMFDRATWSHSQIMQAAFSGYQTSKVTHHE